MNTETNWQDHAALLYRSEAFAEDIEDILQQPLAIPQARNRALRSGWLFALPLALALLGSGSALA
jgi:hypothetical protein